MNVPDWGVPVKMQENAVAEGDGVELPTSNLGGAVIQLVGPFTATVTWEGTLDGVNWVAVPATNRTSGASATTATTAGIYLIMAQGLVKVRARVSAWTDGDIDATGIAVPIYSGL